jgi:L-lactate dehydrogenase complex protein LldF
MLIKLRRDIHRACVSPRGERWGQRLFGRALASPWLYRLGGALQRRLLRRLMEPDGFVEHAPGPLAAWTRERDLRAPAAEPFRDWWARTRGGGGEREGQ